METMKAQQAAIDEQTRQATVLIQRAYQAINQQPAAASSIPLGGVRGDVRCRVFPATLSKVVHQWYFKLPTGRFNSWKAFSSEFHAQFSSSRQLPLHLEDLVEVKQRPGGPLRAYISSFMTNVMKVAGLIEEGRLAAILGVIEVLRELWKDTNRCGRVGSMAEFLDRADEFIKLEEAI
ncbi:uncharacterized protein LOC133035701 [Cannabis sativa]|uniref:uncharacterized protein LOC133035701 n=1 Tax=Cannabis sativa TaxID=3483 RepID=UPI0029C9F7A5|nr:uncharacterized protein LOC133035701 [Cannabis sativa]